MRKTWTFAIPVLAVLLGCASAPSADWQEVRVVEKNEEGMEHLSLPKSLEGCEYLGVVRASVPMASSSDSDPVVPEGVLDALKQKAARKGGNTLAVLPGMRMIQGSLRGSVFRCPATG